VKQLLGELYRYTGQDGTVNNDTDVTVTVAHYNPSPSPNPDPSPNPSPNPQPTPGPDPDPDPNPNQVTVTLYQILEASMIVTSSLSNPAVCDVFIEALVHADTYTRALRTVVRARRTVPAACVLYQRLRAARPGGECCTCAVRVPAPGVPYIPRTGAS
jgi:hypothetical protein